LPSGHSSARSRGGRYRRRAARTAILFASDGMRPDLVDRYAAARGIANMRKLLQRGVEGRNGLTQSFPSQIEGRIELTSRPGQGRRRNQAMEAAAPRRRRTAAPPMK
jgi:hypothetical protein